MKKKWYAAFLTLLFVASAAHAADEVDTVAALKKIGGTIIHVDGDPRKPVRTVFLPGNKVTDADLKLLASLPKLEILKRDGATHNTEEGVKNLASLKQLTEPGLGSTQVTDTGPRSLAGFSELQNLSLRFCKVTDPGLADLTGLSKRELLGLSFTQVITAGVKKLQDALPKCQIIK